MMVEQCIYANGCYNLLCSGFVQINKEIAIGASIFYPVSGYGGSPYSINILVWKLETILLIIWKVESNLFIFYTKVKSSLIFQKQVQITTKKVYTEQHHQSVYPKLSQKTQINTSTKQENHPNEATNREKKCHPKRSM
jgi:hypothetical protein